VLLRDFILLTSGSLRAHRLRSGLTTLGIAVGIASVKEGTFGVNVDRVEELTATIRNVPFST
jgi:hypothetical protein